MTTYKDLEVWKSSMILVQKTYAISRALPSEEKFGLCTQITRASVSIPSNIAEGLGRKGKNETIHFLHIARGSLYELETLIEVVCSIYNDLTSICNDCREILEEVRRIIAGFIRYISKSALR